jgi:autotransporter-associated beta strand protein
MPSLATARRRRFRRNARLLAAVALIAPTAAIASNLDTIGVTQLLALDPTIDGAGVTVGQPEADVGIGDSFEVNPAYTYVGQPAGLFTYTDDFGTVSSTFNPSYESGHADAVAENFYGATGFGVADGVAHVDNQSANYFTSVTVPDLIPISDAVVNQSFIFNEPDGAPLTAADQEAVDTQYDNYIAEYGTIMVSAAGNGGAYPNVNAPATSYNGIGVGDAYGSESIGPTIDNGRSKPDITAPASETSFATPYVSGSAADLVEAGARGDGGTSALLESEAVDPRTIKALLLNGANKTIVTFNRTPTAPLDPVNGAGMVNVFNAYLELAAGQHSASSVSNTSSVGGTHAPLSGGALNSLEGWDFSTLTTSPTNDQYASYVFTPPAGVSYTFTATLVWERQFNSTPSTPLGINNLDLYFYNVTTGTLVDSSVSTVDNVQDVYDLNLAGGDTYDLEVLKNGGTAGVSSGVVSNSETYALAFNFASPAATAVWDTAGGGSWGSTSNWATGIAPQNAGDTAMFAGAATGSSIVTLDGNRTAGIVVFKSDQSYTIAPGSGGTLSLSSPIGSASIIDSNGSHSITAPIALNANTTIAITNATDVLQISGGISGTGSLTETGSGTLLLSGANQYSGGTFLDGGALAITSDSAIQFGTAGLTFSGGALQFSNYASTLSFANVPNLALGAAGGTATLNGAITGTLGLKSIGPGTLILTGNNTYSGGTNLAGGALAISSDREINFGIGGMQFSGGTLQLDNYTSTLSFANSPSLSLGAASGSASRLSGNVTGTSGLNFTGPGTLILAGTNTYSGTTAVNGGRLELANSSAVGTGNLLINAGIFDLSGFSESFASLGGAGGILDNVSAGGNLTLTIGSGNTDSNFSGAIQDTTGTLSLVKIGSGTLNLSGADTYKGSTTISAGALGIASDAAINYGSGGLNFSGGSLQFDNCTSTLSFTNKANLSLGAASGIASTLSGNVTGSLGLKFVGPGTLNLTGTNNFAGGTIISGGALAVGSDAEINHGIGGLTFSGGSLQFNNYTSTLSFANENNLSLGAAAGSASTLDGHISGSSGFTFVGSGTLILTGSNSYTGATTLAGGTLAFPADSAINFGIGGIDFSGGTIQLDNYTSTLSFANIAGLSLGAAVGSASILAGNVTGNSSLAFAGPGTLILAGTNTYTGATTISGGRLELANPAALAGGNLTVNSGTLDLNGFSLSVASLSGAAGTVDNFFAGGNVTLSAGSGNFSGTIADTTGALSLVKIGAGTLALTGTNSYTGGTTVNAGELQINNPSSIGPGPLVINGGMVDLAGANENFSSLSGGGTIDDNTGVGGVTLSVGSGNVNTTYSGSITDSQGLISLYKTGSGTLVLTGTNSYVGATTVISGSLAIAGPAALPNSTELSIGNGSTPALTQLAAGTSSFTLSTLTISTGSRLDVGASPVLVDYGYFYPAAQIVSYLQSGYAGGSWNGVGIMSSAIAPLNASQSALVYSVGYADGADGIVAGLSSGEIEILPTLAGDAKLQGDVVFGDFQLLSQYFGQSGGWDEGNFTYGSTIDFADFQLLAQNFGANSSGLTANEVASLNGFAAQFGDTLVSSPSGIGFQIISVPEPMTGGVLTMAGVALLRRQRRKLTGSAVDHGNPCGE